MSTSDADLVAAIEHAYRDGYRRFYRWRSGCSATSTARMRGAEAFAHALRSRGNLQYAGNLDAWLWRIVVNVCRVETRHPLTALDERYELEANGHPQRGPSSSRDRGAPRATAARALLRHYADLDYETIAQVMGIERGTVAATLHAAHRKVRDAMTEVPR